MMLILMIALTRCSGCCPKLNSQTSPMLAPDSQELPECARMTAGFHQAWPVVFSRIRSVRSMSNWFSFCRVSSIPAGNILLDDFQLKLFVHVHTQFRVRADERLPAQPKPLAGDCF